MQKSENQVINIKPAKVTSIPEHFGKAKGKVKLKKLL